MPGSKIPRAVRDLQTTLIESPVRSQRRLSKLGTPDECSGLIPPHDATTTATASDFTYGKASLEATAFPLRQRSAEHPSDSRRRNHGRKSASLESDFNRNTKTTAAPREHSEIFTRQHSTAQNSINVDSASNTHTSPDKLLIDKKVAAIGKCTSDHRSSDSKDAIGHRSSDSKSAIGHRSSESKPAIGHRSSDSKSAIGHRSSDSKPANPHQSSDSKPANPHQSSDSKPAIGHRSSDSKSAIGHRSSERKTANESVNRSNDLKSLTDQRSNDKKGSAGRESGAACVGPGKKRRRSSRAASEDGSTTVGATSVPSLDSVETIPRSPSTTLQEMQKASGLLRSTLRTLENKIALLESQYIADEHHSTRLLRGYDSRLIGGSAYESIIGSLSVDGRDIDEELNKVPRTFDLSKTFYESILSRPSQSATGAYHLRPVCSTPSDVNRIVKMVGIPMVNEDNFAIQECLFSLSSMSSRLSSELFDFVHTTEQSKGEDEKAGRHNQLESV